MSALHGHHRRDSCRLCGSRDLELVFRLAPTPPANAFLKSEEIRSGREVKYPLDLFFCASCSHLQLLDVVDPEILFRDYVYVSGTSPVFVDHFRRYRDFLFERYSLKSGQLAFEIGSNDGTLLRFFAEKGMKVLGADPATKIAEGATASGIPTLPIFFEEGAAREIRETHGKASVILANNVFAHIDDLSAVTRGVELLLADDGIFAFEVSYLVDVVEKTLFDTIYHEHLSYHAVAPLLPFFERHGLELIDAVRVDSHGGSLRGIVQKKGGPWKRSAGVDELLRLEKVWNLQDPQAYRKFAMDIESLGRRLGERLRDLKSQGKSIAAFGAPAKATTLMHHFRLGAELVDFIVDDSPWKQGLFSPGTHIPVVPSEQMYRAHPDYMLVLAWNFADPIIKKHQKFLEQGGHFIVPLPQLKEL
jgi:SAM-dependent methyltransferase